MKSAKVVCLLLVLVITASALGCIGQKEGASTKTPLSTEKTTQTSIAQTNGIAESDITMTESDITQLDSMMNDMSMDIFLSDVNI